MRIWSAFCEEVGKSGKSSIINSINCNEFTECIPSIVEDVYIPRGFAKNHTSLLFRDTSCTVFLHQLNRSGSGRRYEKTRLAEIGFPFVFSFIFRLM